MCKEKCCLRSLGCFRRLCFYYSSHIKKPTHCSYSQSSDVYCPHNNALSQPQSHVGQIQVPMTRCVKTYIPVQRYMRTQVPVQRPVYGTSEIVVDVIVNKQKCETYTTMLPQQTIRWINVPCTEKKIQHVPTIDYVTELQDNVEYINEIQEKIDYVIEYVTRQIKVYDTPISCYNNITYQQNRLKNSSTHEKIVKPSSLHYQQNQFNPSPSPLHENIVLPFSAPANLVNKHFHKKQFNSSLSPVQENSNSFTSS